MNAEAAAGLPLATPALTVPPSHAEPGVASLAHARRAAMPRSLRALEAEAIHVFREVVAEFEKPVLLYSIGKDSSVLLHLALKAFAPGRLPFPVLHIASGWDFRDMIAFRDHTVRTHGLDLVVHTNLDGLREGLTPWSGPRYADLMLTSALKQALDAGGWDAAFGGGRRDEEKARAKERVISFRDERHRWDPRNQRPELWRHYNGRVRRGQRVRAFPLSNWTEADVWTYIHFENVPLVPLYFAADRPVVERNGSLIVVDDERLPLQPGEVPRIERVRFRTLGCYPLTAAIRSDATTVPEVIAETLSSKESERAGRLVDGAAAASMERKKAEGYF
jgi:sulfate adenylyltransferase subunit 2